MPKVHQEISPELGVTDRVVQMTTLNSMPLVQDSPFLTSLRTVLSKGCHCR